MVFLRKDVRRRQSQIQQRTPHFLKILPANETAWLKATHYEDLYRQCWDIDVQDSSGHGLADFSWDASTGELLSVEVATHRDSVQAQAMTVSGALRQAHFWLQQLGLASARRHWQVACPPTLEAGKVWYFRWKAEGQILQVKLNAYSGSLIEAVCSPMAG